MFGIGTQELIFLTVIPVIMLLIAFACLIQIRNAIQRIDRRLSEMMPAAGDKTCPHCGKPNPAHEQLCIHCANRI